MFEYAEHVWRKPNLCGAPPSPRPGPEEIKMMAGDKCYLSPETTRTLPLDMEILIILIRFVVLCHTKILATRLRSRYRSISAKALRAARGLRPHLFSEILLSKVFFLKYFLWKYFFLKYLWWNIFSEIFLTKHFFFKIICIFFQKYFWWKYFWWKYFWWKYFWQKYFLWIYFWSFHLVTKGFPFSHQGPTPPYTSFWSEVWRTHGRTHALSVPFIVLDCGQLAWQDELGWSRCWPMLAAGRKLCKLWKLCKNVRVAASSNWVQTTDRCHPHHNTHNKTNVIF